MRIVLIILFIVSVFDLSAQCLKGDCSNGKGRYKFENGSIYFGQFKQGQLHGKGTMKYASGDVYTGNWVDNKRHGGGKFVRANGNTYEGKFENNKLNGKGRLIYASNDRIVGFFVDNVPQGEGKIFYRNGNVYEGEIEAGKMHGFGSMRYKNGDHYRGGWKKNKKHGKGFFQWASGKHIVGVWVDGKRDKTAKVDSNEIDFGHQEPKGRKKVYVFRYGDGTRYEGEMNNGQPEGEGVVYYSSGDKYIGGWRNHAPHGKGIMHFANGFKYATEWNNGVPGKAMFDNSDQIERKNYAVLEESEDVNIYAMIVGVSSYNHMPSLRFTDDDAYQFYAFLKSPEGGAVPDERISLLIDDAATKRNILNEMESLFRKADKNDVVLMYYSGHGLQGSFVPHDYDGYNNTIAHQDILTIFDNSPAKHKICIADACHSGSLYASRGSLGTALQDYYQGFENASSGTALLLSSKREEVSLEYSGLRQGVFSHYLIRGLKGEANVNEDKQVSVSELFQFVSQRVREYTAFNQNPNLSGDFDPQMPLAMVR